ncbi:MAG: terminase small subunit [Pseudomonadota bacterium]
MPETVPLDDLEMPFFAAIIAKKPTSEWEDHDLQVAALLAREMCLAEKETRLLADEGSVVTTPKGLTQQNARVPTVHGIAARIKNYRQTLAIHGAAMGNARDVGSRRTKVQKIEAGLRKDDPLLAGTRH